MSIQKTLENITAADPLWRDRAKDRINSLTMPPWALGRLLDLAVDIAGRAPWWWRPEITVW
jgi:nicotinate-nucleotide--dimethylbenzimidazole phosphoribosyltransferase